MPEDAGSVAIAEPVGSVSTETSTETPVSSEETSQGVDSIDSPAQKQDLTEKASGNGKLKLADIAKTKAAELKAIDPALPAAIQKAGHELGRFYGEFPGGLKEAVALKQTLSEYGGVEGLKEVTAAVSDYAALEQKFETANPEFWKIADEMPQSFSQIMPAGLEKWKEKDPEM